MADSATVSYVIPNLGKIQVNFFDFAVKVYNVFKKDEIRRLRGLKQLGQLEKIHPGAHHTRWEYIMLQLYLMRVFKESTPGLGLGRDVASLGLGSGLEALQIYTLLQNCGHLEGSFETERLVLEACVENKVIRNRILQLLPTKFREWAEQLIENEEVFQFYKLLSVIFWVRGDDFRSDRRINRRCLDILHAFYVEADSQIQVLKERHRSIRTIAYLALDMQYAPVGIGLNLSPILVGAQEFGQRIFTGRGSEFSRLTTHIEEYLTDVVYESPVARWAFLEFRRLVYPKILVKMRQFNKKSDFFHYLYQLREHTPKYSLDERPVYTKVSLWRPFSQRRVIKPISTPHQFAKRLGIEPNDVALKEGRAPYYSPMAYVYHPLRVIQEEGEISRRFNVFCKEITRLEESSVRRFKRVPPFWGFRRQSETMQSLFRSVLYLLTDNSYEIVLETAGIPENLQAICFRSKPVAIKQVKRLLDAWRKRGLPEDRMAELECIRETVSRNYGGVVSVCLSNIKILHRRQFWGEQKDLEAAEIDGAVLITNKLHTKILLIESKNKDSGSVSEARKQLEKLFPEKIDLAKGFADCIEGINDIPKKGAFLTIRFPGKQETVEE